MNKKFTFFGFSLIELLIVLTISAILLLLALPSYHSLLQKNYRQQAKVTLLALSATLEVFYNEQGTYKGAPIHSTPHYNIILKRKKNNGYQLVAIPIDAQRSDPCGQLGLDDQRQKLALIPTCWE